jgi:Fur family peroxide stress response transcriptional regulator
MANPEDRYDAMVEKLRAHHFKLTPQRLAIVRILCRSNGHPNVDMIYQQLQGDFPTMSLATVYRNVMIVKSLGEVLELGFPDGSNRYDGNKPYPHPHMICVQCRKIIDPDLATLKDLTEEVVGETGFSIISHRLDFFGVCRECRLKTS